MKQLLVSLCLSLVVFGVTQILLHNELVAGLVAGVVLFLMFFWLCLLAVAHNSDELSYSDRRY
jgi:hypothetical protein